MDFKFSCRQFGGIIYRWHSNKHFDFYFREIKYFQLKLGGNVGEKKLDDKMSGKKEVAEHFGVTIRAIETWMKNSGLPYYKIGALVRFNMNEVVKWKQERRIVND